MKLKKIIPEIFAIFLFVFFFLNTQKAHALSGCQYGNIQARWNWNPLLTVPLEQNRTDDYGRNAAYYYHTTHDQTGDPPPSPPGGYTRPGYIVSVVGGPQMFSESQSFNPVYQNFSSEDIARFKAALNTTDMTVLPVNFNSNLGAYLVFPYERNIRELLDAPEIQGDTPYAGAYKFMTFQKYYGNPDGNGTYYNDRDVNPYYDEGLGSYKIFNGDGTVACPQSANKYGTIGATPPAGDNIATLTLNPYNDSVCVNNNSVANPPNDFSIPGTTDPNGDPTIVVNPKVYAGGIYTAAVVAQNYGGSEWTTANRYFLASTDPTDNTNWGYNRVDIQVDTVSPGNLAFFQFTNLTAPLTSGIHPFNWNMKQDGVDWFGQKCAANVKVIAPPTAIVSGPTIGMVSSTYTYTGNTTSGLGTNLTQGELYVAKKDKSDPATWGCTGEIHGAWCLINRSTLSSSTTQSFQGSWVPAQAGDYYVAVNVFGADEGRCSGNTWCKWNGSASCEADPTGANCQDCEAFNNGWKKCDPNGSADRVSVNIQTVSVGNLSISVDDTTGAVASGTYGKTGLRTDEGGKNYYNALRITQGVTNGNINNVALVGTAFTQKNPSPVPTTLASLKTYADSGNGFVLVYANQSTNYTGGPAVGACGMNFCEGLYYVYFKGVWNKPNQNPPHPEGYQPGDLMTNYRNIDQGLQVLMRSATTSFPAGPTFTAYLYKTITSPAYNNVSWNTYGYVMDIGGNEFASPKQPLP